MIYMIQGEAETSPVRIGYARNAHAAMGLLLATQLHHFDDLSIIRQGSGGFNDLRTIFNKFLHITKKNNWYEFNEEFLTVNLDKIINHNHSPKIPKTTYLQRKGDTIEAPFLERAAWSRMFGLPDHEVTTPIIDDVKMIRVTRLK